MREHQQIPRFDYDTPSVALVQILDWLEEHIDLEHLVTVEDRHIRALNWEPVDRPPISLSAPVPEPLAVYPYSEAFQDPTKMLVNELVGPYAAVGPSESIVNSVVFKDDSPLQIRAAYGTGLFVSLFGVESEVLGDNFPWVRPVGLESVKELVGRGVPDLNGDLFRRALGTMAYYREVLAPYPKCRQAIHITQPDLQGVFESAGLLWGGEIFTAFYDCPDFLRELLDLLAETWVLACRRLAAESTETARDGFIYLHFSIFKGNCLLKDDSCVMLSPDIYADFIRPVNEKVLKAMGGGGIHFCGNGDQWRSEMLDTENLVCVDFGQPCLFDLPAWVTLLRDRSIGVGRMEWPVEEFLRVDPAHLFPTGAAFTVILDDFAQAGEIMRDWST